MGKVGKIVPVSQMANNPIISSSVGDTLVYKPFSILEVAHKESMSEGTDDVYRDDPRGDHIPHG